MRLSLLYNEENKKGGDFVTEKELLQRNIEEFSRLQNYMVLCEKDSQVYKLMKQRYIELKVILNASDVNLIELDIIKE
jgi:hypothetical protein